MATTVQTITATGTTNWVAPAGVTSLTVELWGGGGSGGPATGTASGAGGGAGGQYASSVVTVVPGTTYAVVVAAAKAAATSAVGNGNDSTFASTTVIAKGGAGGAQATAATSLGGAGSVTGGVGTTVNAGGSGGNGVSSTQSGGGGSGAGSTGTGNSGSGATAGLAKTANGGAGGTGTTVAATSNPGSNYGGGGAGGLSNTATDRAGGNGAQGLAVLTYTNPAISTFTDAFSSATRDAYRWPAQFVGTGMSLSQASGALVFTTSTTASAYSGYDSTATYDLTGSSLYMQLVSGGNQSVVGLEVQPFGLIADANNAVGWYLNGGTLAAWKKVATARSNVSTVAYNSTNHQWLRIRESGGTTFWDTSADGTTWNNLTSVANPITLTALQIEPSVGTYQIEAVQTTVTMDNFNVAPPATLTKTQPAIARIANIKTATQPAIARVATNPTKTQPAVAKIASAVTKTQPAIAKIANIKTKTQPAISRIAINSTKTQPAVSRIATNRTATQPAIARVANVQTKTQAATASISTANTVVKTQPATARIANIITKTQPAVARVANTKTKTQPAISRISQTFTKTQPAVARVAVVVAKTQPAVARVATNPTKTQPAIARVANTKTKTQPAISRISQTFTKTQPATARVATSPTKTQPAIARIATIRTKTQPAIARVSNTKTKTQAAISRIAIKPTKTQPAIARVANTRTKTQSATASIMQAFTWKGYSWQPRFGSGAPTYNNQWLQSNVIGPDINDYMTLRVSNPTGSSPYAAEFSSVQNGWGYGTYTVVVGTRMDNLNPAIVLGGMFTYDPTTATGDTAISHNEIDPLETANGGTSPGYWWNNSGVDTDITTTFAATSDIVTTHQLVWAPGKLVMRAFAGTGTGGTLLHAVSYTSHIPVPALEKIYFNLWVQNAHTPSVTPQTDVVIRDFTFSPIPLNIFTQSATAYISVGVSQLTEDFSAATIDTTKWVSFNGGTNTISQATGQLVINTTTTPAYSGYDSVNLYDLTGNAASIKVLNAGNQALASLEVFPVQLIKDGSNSLFWYISGNTIAAYKRVAGTNTAVSSTAYISATHKYFRVRESGGTIFWDYSTNGTTWTNLTSIANPFSVTSMQVEASVGTFSAEASGTAVTFDDFNVFPITRTKTQPAIARIATKPTKTQPATATISNTKTKTQSATAHITSARTKTQSATARISSAKAIKTQTATAKIAVRRTKTQSAKARISPTIHGGLRYWGGSSWIFVPVKVWNGSAWVIRPLKKWNGSAWVALN